MEHALQPYTALVPRTDKLVVQKAGHTALVTIDNPPANTWDSDTLHGLPDLLRHLNNDPDIYALVLTGRGERFFSAGADLKMFADGNPARAREMARLFGLAFEALRDFSGVTIAAINGYAMGGGWSALWPAIFASPSGRRRWRCRRRASACCPAREALRRSPGWLERAGPSA